MGGAGDMTWSRRGRKLHDRRLLCVRASRERSSCFTAVRKMVDGSRFFGTKKFFILRFCSVHCHFRYRTRLDTLFTYLPPIRTVDVLLLSNGEAPDICPPFPLSKTFVSVTPTDERLE